MSSTRDDETMAAAGAGWEKEARAPGAAMAREWREGAAADEATGLREWLDEPGAAGEKTPSGSGPMRRR